jgi:hypothetical protein
MTRMHGYTKTPVPILLGEPRESNSRAAAASITTVRTVWWRCSMKRKPFAKGSEARSISR